MKKTQEIKIYFKKNKNEYTFFIVIPEKKISLPPILKRLNKKTTDPSSLIENGIFSYFIKDFQNIGTQDLPNSNKTEPFYILQDELFAYSIQIANVVEQDSQPNTETHIFYLLELSNASVSKLDQLKGSSSLFAHMFSSLNLIEDPKTFSFLYPHDNEKLKNTIPLPPDTSFSSFSIF